MSSGRFGNDRVSHDTVADLDGLARFRTEFASGARALGPVVPGVPQAEALPRFPAWYVVALHLAALLLLWGPPLHFAPPGQEGRDQKGRTAMAAVRAEFTGGALIQVGVAGAMFGLIGLAAAASIIRRRPIGLWARCTSGPTLALLAFAAIAAASAAYSPGPLLTLYRAAELAGMVLLFHLVAMSWPGRGAEMLLRLIEGWFLVIGCYNLIAHHVAPDLVTTNAGRLLGGSYFMRDNGLAGLFLFVAASARMTQVLSWRSRFGVLSWLPQMLLGGYLVWLSGTRAYLLLAPAGFLLLLALRRRLSLGLGVGALVLATMMLYEGVAPQVREKMEREEGTMDTLSGRTVAWTSFVDLWRERPLTGYGYAAGPRAIAVRGRMETFAQTHNAYLAVLLGTGLFGAAAVAAMILVIARRAILIAMRPDPLVRPAYSVTLAFVVVFLAAGMTSQSFAGERTLEQIACVAALVAFQDVAYRPPAGSVGFGLGPVVAAGVAEGRGLR